MSSLFSNSMIATIKRVKKTFLWSAVCILIGEVVVGAILILTQSFNETIGKLMATFALCAIVLFVGVNNFTRMEKGEKLVQGFALASLVLNIVWLVLAILFIYEVISPVEGGYLIGYSLTSAAKIAIIAADLAWTCFWVSNVWAIAETVKPVKPLKITALVCELYCGAYAVVATLWNDVAVLDSRWNALAGLAGFAFIVMACAAVIVSRSGVKNTNSIKVEEGMNNADMQAKIQEMVEREVQARMAAQQNLPPVLNPDANQPKTETPVEEHPNTETIDRHFE